MSSKLSTKQPKPQKSASNFLVGKTINKKKSTKRKFPDSANSPNDQRPNSKTSKPTESQTKKAKTAAQSKHKKPDSPDHMKICSRIINELFSKKHYSFAWPFYIPVDAESQGLYDYFDIIECPMDLGTIKKKITSRLYKSVDEFASDVRLIFNNCYTYNPPDHEIVPMAKKLEKIFETSYDKIPQHLKTKLPDLVHDCEIPVIPKADDTSAEIEHSSGDSDTDEEWLKKLLETSGQIAKLQDQVQSLRQRQQQRKDKNPKKKIKKSRKKLVDDISLQASGKAVWIDHTSPKIKSNDLALPQTKSPVVSSQESSSFVKSARSVSHWNSDEDDDDRLPIDEIRQLASDINKLAGTQLAKVVQIIKSREPSYQHYNDGNIEIDFEILQSSTLRELQKFISSCTRNKPKPFVVRRKSEKSPNEQLAEREKELNQRLNDMNGKLGFSTKTTQTSDLPAPEVRNDTGPNLSDSSSSSSSSNSSDSSSDSSTSEED